MQAVVRGVWDAGPPDVVIASQIDMAPYALGLPDAVRLLDEVELAGYWEQVELAKGLLRRTRRRLMWAKRAAYTRRVLAGFDAVYRRVGNGAGACSQHRPRPVGA